MKRFRWNTILFLVVLGILLIVATLPDSFFFYEESKPWQLEPFGHEDSLCVEYKSKYSVIDQNSILLKERDTSRTVAIILVDAWGTPLKPDLLDEDFSFFKNLPCKFAIHKRLANRNVHAELVEFRDKATEGLFIFGGDSLEYNRTSYLPNLGLKHIQFCNLCDDAIMLKKLDSLLVNPPYSKIAWTTQSSREGNRKNLHKTLDGIAQLAAKHPNVKFIVVGTHRPILGSPKTRRMYHAHWVPAVVIH